MIEHQYTTVHNMNAMCILIYTRFCFARNRDSSFPIQQLWFVTFFLFVILLCFFLFCHASCFPPSFYVVVLLVFFLLSCCVFVVVSMCFVVLFVLFVLYVCCLLVVVDLLLC